MKNTITFMRLVKSRRKELLGAGYKPSRLSMWAHGNRHPSYKEAVKISKLLDIDVNTIPYSGWAVND